MRAAAARLDYFILHVLLALLSYAIDRLVWHIVDATHIVSQSNDIDQQLTVNSEHRIVSNDAIMLARLTISAAALYRKS